MQKKVITVFRNLTDIYEDACQPICKEMGVPHTAFTILMFLADNPEYDTAKDVCKFRAIKPNIVSFNVNKLVDEGYLERQLIPENRRSIRLVCTDKAQPFIEKGRKIIQQFYLKLTAGMSEEDVARFHGYMELIGENIIEIKRLLEEGKKKNV